MGLGGMWYTVYQLRAWNFFIGPGGVVKKSTILVASTMLAQRFYFLIVVVIRQQVCIGCLRVFPRKRVGRGPGWTSFCYLGESSFLAHLVVRTVLGESAGIG